MKEIIKKHRKRLIIFKRNQIIREIQYYENLYDPEHKHNTGFSVNERLEMAKERLEKSKYWSNPEISKTDLVYFLRSEAIDCYRTATDFPENIWLKNRYLRETVNYIKDLFEAFPDLGIYSKKAIVNPRIILEIR